MSQSLNKDFWITTFLPFSAAMAASGTLIPLFILAMGGGAADIGWLSALSSCVSLPLAFIWGKLTDDTGQRKIFIIIMFISGFGVIFGYFLTGIIPGNFTWLIGLSVLSGLLLGSGDTAKNMYIFDSYPPDQWEEKISKYQQRTGIGACLGLVFGGVFQMVFVDSYAIFFLICALLCGGSAVLGFLVIKDIAVDKIIQKAERTPVMNLDLPYYSSIYTPRKTISYQVKDKESPSKRQMTKTLVLFFLGSFTLYLASNFTFTPLPAFMSVDLLIMEFLIFWIYLGYYAISVLGYTFAGNWIDKHGNRKILLIGVITRIAVYGAFAIFAIFTLTIAGSAVAYTMIIILLICSGISYSLMNVALQNTLPRLIEKNIGEILALYSIVVGISAIIGSFLSGFIAETLGYPWLFLLSVIFGVLALVIYLKAVKKDIK